LITDETFYHFVVLSTQFALCNTFFHFVIQVLIAVLSQKGDSKGAAHIQDQLHQQHHPL
jgi:hypothetical protein